ncbi:hypothetical protein B0J14DRAFT_631719 [Halenospora varia]|nr:hypothetical protein B0J14DRAFT_631719 [Halenospora varia]
MRIATMPLSYRHPRQHAKSEEDDTTNRKPIQSSPSSYNLFFKLTQLSTNKESRIWTTLYDIKMPTYQSLDLRSLRGAKEGTPKENKDQPEKQKHESPPGIVSNSTSSTESPPSPPLTPKASTSIPANQNEDTTPISKSTPFATPSKPIPTAKSQITVSSPSPCHPQPTSTQTSIPKTTGPTLLQALSTLSPPPPPISTHRQPKDMTDQEYLSHLGHNSMYDFMSIYDLKTWRHGDYEEARTILHALRDREQERVEEERKS